jgi:hypothetical protein
MGQNWDESGRQHVEKQLFKPRRRHMMRGLHQDIAGVGQRQQVAAVQARHEVRNNVIVRPGDQPQGNALVVENPL